jgi:hypothetical protein
VSLVLDASFCLAWIFRRQRADQAELADRVLQRRDQEQWIVPTLWPLEVANALLVAERRAVIQPEQSESFLGKLAALRTPLDPFAGDLSQPRLLGAGAPAQSQCLRRQLSRTGPAPGSSIGQLRPALATGGTG